MRNCVSLFVIGPLISTGACTQNPAASEVVESAFNQKFPNAKKVTWEMEDASTWEAEFKLDDVDYSSNFDLQGQWVETEHEIKTSEIPASIQAILDQEFSDFKIDEAEITEKAAGKFYEIAVEKGKEGWELIFDFEGNLIEKNNSNEE